MSPIALICCLLSFFLTVKGAQKANLSCYQCVRYENQECDEDQLVPCSPVFDRCVTHIAKDDKRGYMIKRECGLGPCAFEDNMANRGLGLDGCDRSKDEYFCVSCCRASGCNKSGATTLRFSATAFVSTFAAITSLIYVFH